MTSKLSDWNFTKAIADGVVENKNGIIISSVPYGKMGNELMSHFQCILIHSSRSLLTKDLEFSWKASGVQVYPKQIPLNFVKRTANLQADPRFCSPGLLLMDHANGLLLGFLFTNQVIYAITGKHPIPQLVTFDDFKKNASLDEYVRFVSYGKYIEEKISIPWEEYLINNPPYLHEDDYKTWKQKGSLPKFWDTWCSFCSSLEAHLGLVSLYRRSSSDEVVKLTVKIKPNRSVEWSINDVSLFKQVKIGVKLLDKQMALDTGASSITPESVRLTPVVGTFSWMDLIHPEDKRDPLVVLHDNYYCPLSDSMGIYHKLKKNVFVSNNPSDQGFGQGAILHIESYSFSSDEVGKPTVFTSSDIIDLNSIGRGIKIKESV